MELRKVYGELEKYKSETASLEAEVGLANPLTLQSGLGSI